MVAVRVLDGAVVRERPVEATGGDDRELEDEIDHPLEDRRLVADERPHAIELGRLGDAVLALAVVAEGRGLEDRRHPHPLDRGGELVERADRLERRDRESLQPEERLFAGALLRDVQRVAAGAHRHDLGGGIGGGGRDVLELEGDHVDTPREGPDGVEVVVVGVDLDVGHLAGGRVEGRRQRVHAVAHAPGRDGEHPTELPAAQHAERGAGKHDAVHGKASSRTERD